MRRSVTADGLLRKSGLTPPKRTAPSQTSRNTTTAAVRVMAVRCLVQNAATPEGIRRIERPYGVGFQRLAFSSIFF